MIGVQDLERVAVAIEARAVGPVNGANLRKCLHYAFFGDSRLDSLYLFSPFADERDARRDWSDIAREVTGRP